MKTPDKLQQLLTANAIANGDEKALDEVVGSGQPLPFGAFVRAVRNGQSHIVNRMLVESPSMIRQKELDSALFIAVQKVSYDLVEALVNAKANPNTPGDLLGTSAFALAKKSRNQRMLTVLMNGEGNTEVRPDAPLSWLRTPRARSTKLSNQSLGLKPPLKRVSNLKAAQREAERLTGITPIKLKGLRDAWFVFPTARHSWNRRKLDTICRQIDSVLLPERKPFVLRTYCKNRGTGLAIVNASSKFEVMRLLKTSSKRYGVSNRWLISKLRKLDVRWPFELEECGSQSFAGRFMERVKEPPKIAAELLLLSPLVEGAEGNKPVNALAKYLQRNQAFAIGWD